ncbi:MAG: NAD-dependent epimerase/dehydratase family protein [Bacteroidia bacterium]|nr:NAD-dependent epimerase/dehydratase family protein [Bacteroidia bacterium]
MIFNKIIRTDIKEVVQSNISWKKFKDKHILITGANGFLPSYLVYSLLEANEIFKLNLCVTALVRNLDKAQRRFSDYLENKSFFILHQDVNDRIENKNYNFIIHAASQASPKYYSIDPVGTLKPNIIGTTNLLELAVESNVTAFLYFSSSEVYGQIPDSENPIKEDQFGYLDPAKVRSCYAESKRMGETLCVSYYHQYGVPVKIVRPFHTYGPGMDLNDGRVYADFVRNIIQNENINLNSDGSAKRAFCYIKDATIGFLLTLLEGKHGESYNIGNQTEEYSIKNLAEILVDLYSEKNLKVTTNNIPDINYTPSKVNRNCPNCSKVTSLGWKVTTTVQDGFQRTINSYQ